MPAPSASQRAYDPLLRVIHAWNAFAIVGLVASSQFAEALEHGGNEALAWSIHVQFGYALIGGLVVRLVWGFVGPANARWSDLWHSREWAAMLGLRFFFPKHKGHDPLASLAFLALYAVLALMATTGLALTGVEYGAGPLASLPGDERLKDFFEEPHEFGFALVLGFIALHLGALAFHRFILRSPLGYKMLGGNPPHTKETRHA